MYCIIISNILLKICSESSLNLCEHLAKSHGHIAKRALSYLFFAYSLYSNMVVANGSAATRGASSSYIDERELVLCRPRL